VHKTFRSVTTAVLSSPSRWIAEGGSQVTPFSGTCFLEIKIGVQLAFVERAEATQPLGWIAERSPVRATKCCRALMLHVPSRHFRFTPPISQVNISCPSMLGATQFAAITTVIRVRGTEGGHAAAISTPAGGGSEQRFSGVHVLFTRAGACPHTRGTVKCTPRAARRPA